MAFNGSGVFNRVHDWTNDAAAHIKIVSSRHDENDDDIAQGLSNTLCRDGQSTVTADISLSTHKLTNLAAPTADTDAATKGYVDGPRARTNGIDISGAGSPNGMLTFSSATGANGLSFKAADLSWLARMAGTPSGSLNRLALNDKVDGSGTDVAVVTDSGNLSVSGTVSAAGAVTSGGQVTATSVTASKAATGNVHFWLYGPNNEDRMVLYSNAAAAGSAFLRVTGTQTFEFNTSGQFRAPGAIFAASALLNTDGNTSGTVWDQWGAHDAISAISARIEARAQAWANNKVASTQMQRTAITYSGAVGYGGWVSPGGTVIVGYNREAGATGQVAGLYYATLQIYDNINGWRNMGG